MTPPRKLVVAAVVFGGAFLLFQVQPMISKLILPWYGGSPAVWTTCLLFFQAFLLLGYYYADRLVALASQRRAILVHGGLLVVACATLPITRAERFQPVDVQHPTGRILVMLSATIGLTYLALAATGPLVQAWYARRLSSGSSPYRLYALSNLGSMGALLSYPLAVEPWLSLRWQGWLWSIGFGIYAGLMAVLMWMTVGRLGLTGEQSPVSEHDRGGGVSEGGQLRWTQWAAWLLWPLLASTLLLAVTNQICQNIAVIPFLWIAPLSVYLLSFILCFDRPRWYDPRSFGLAAAISLLWIARLQMAHAWGDSTWYFDSEWFRRLAGRPTVQIASYLVSLFLVSMVCHGQLERAKPASHGLTRFYLAIAAGGALGGLFVALLCPWLFHSYYELKLSLAIAMPLVLINCYLSARQNWLRRRVLRGAFLVAAIGSGLLVIGAQLLTGSSAAFRSVRNFYGVLTVTSTSASDGGGPMRRLYSGTPAHGAKTLHGYQDFSAENRRKATTYFAPSTGVGLAIDCWPEASGRHVGIVGLGVGTLAAYGRTGDTFRFYEINPAVAEVARQDFTYLKDSQATIDVLLGDGRLLLEREVPRAYDLLIIDAFTGDTIPTHLLTREAFAVYLEKQLQPAGVLAIHISNRYLDLAPPVARLADEFQWPCYLVQNKDGPDMAFASDWIVITRNEAIRHDPRFLARAKRLSADPSFPPWTDQYNNLFRLLLRGRPRPA